jgi:hypothetical protein
VALAMLTAEQTTALQQQFMQQIQQQKQQQGQGQGQQGQGQQGQGQQGQGQAPLPIQQPPMPNQLLQQHPQAPQDESQRVRRVAMDKAQKQLDEQKRKRVETEAAGGASVPEKAVVEQTLAEVRWDAMRAALTRLDKPATKQATRIFPANFCIDFKSPLLIISNSKWELQLPEAQILFAMVMNNTLHQDIIHLSGTQFLITTIKARSYYGHSLDTESGTGIVVRVLDKCILVGLYSKPMPATSFIPLVEHFANEIIPLGY